MDDRNTLRFQLARPLCLQRNMSAVPMAVVAAQVRKHVVERYEGDLASPVTEAIRFYVLNHAVAMLRQRYEPDEPLSPDATELLELYHGELNDLAIRMFSYLAMICTRETRHGEKPATLKTEIVKRFGQALWDWHSEEIIDSESDEAQRAFMEADLDPSATIGLYTEMMPFIFYSEDCGWVVGDDCGVGGAKWGVVADVLKNFVHGTTSAEMMLDTAFTLAHNGGPIFNKGMVFSYPDRKKLYQILDVQASGQIPQLFAEDGEPSGIAGHLLPVQYLYEHCAAVLGPEFSTPGYVDWWKVEATAKQGDWYHLDHLKAGQAAMHGMPQHASEAEKDKAERQQIAAAKTQAYGVAYGAKKGKDSTVKAEMAHHQYEYAPGKFVAKGKRDDDAILEVPF